jgi:hypothetical protein
MIAWMFEFRQHSHRPFPQQFTCLSLSFDIRAPQAKRLRCHRFGSRKHGLREAPTLIAATE